MIPLQNVPRPRHGIFGQFQKFSFCFTFSKEGKELRSAPLDGAGTRPENGPEVVSGVLEVDGREEFFDLDSLHDLIGVRIRSCTCIIRKILSWRENSRATAGLVWRN
ncbi:hypothetical protein [Deinococcus marmoris]|uniref:hypothetical protein n=1 Tax=Deinococcus marmoris TaxID=249408 RepID=UPI0012DE6469|nr:hypothetical protein [Deinococcus marmoris]